MSILLYFLQSIPESMGIVALSLAIARVPLKWAHISLAGILLAIISYVIRSLPVTFGLHLPVMILIIFMLIVKYTNLKPSLAIVAVFTSFFTLALLEYLVSGTFFAYTQTDPEQALSNEKLWSILGIIQAIILNIIALVVPRYLKPTEGAWKQ